MLARILAGLGLMALTVVVHSLGLSVLLRWLVLPSALGASRFWGGTWLLIRLAWCLIAIHTIEIALWGAFYWWQGCLPDLHSALYFSGVTYTTIGYGDLVLPPEWRLAGPVEGLTGILMCGLSTGFFFAVMRRMYAFEVRRVRT